MIGFYIGWMKFATVWIVVAGLVKTGELIWAVLSAMI